MKKLYYLSIILLTTMSFGQTPISLIGVNVPYSENFDGMGATLTTFIPGWTAINTANGANLFMAVTDGTASTGNVYNVGLVNGEDRALGLIADATTTPTLGAVFQNNTGNFVSKISIQTRMEQWKESGNASINESILFYYSLNATSLNTGSWTAVTALDLKEKLTGATSNNAVNGNLAANYSNLANIISGINWENGTNLWIKWVDTNDTGANGMFAIENFVISIAETLDINKNTITGLNVYPNPVSNGTLYITSSSNSEKLIVIYDVIGKQIMNTITANNTVNVSDLKNGIYIVKITEDGKTDTKKLIIE
jgi:hypothetical protein